MSEDVKALGIQLSKTQPNPYIESGSEEEAVELALHKAQEKLASREGKS